MPTMVSTPSRILLVLTAAGALSFLDAGASSALDAEREARRDEPRTGFDVEKRSPRTQGPGRVTLQQQTGERRAATTMLATKPSVTLTPCEDDAEWLCGLVKVPVDRARPTGRTLSLKVAVFPHTNADSTRRDPVFATDGGPGASNYQSRGFLQFLNDGLTEDRDLVVVDHRGTGSSEVINCPVLEQVLGDPYVETQRALQAIGACGRSLGGDADRYGSGDIAMDLDAVRAALGYRRINLYGLSYGGTFLSAYATRFPDRLRSLVIDAGTPATDPQHTWTWGTDIPPAMAAHVALHCDRAPACARAQPDARTALARLAAAVRRHPVNGTADISGLGVLDVKVTELVLATIAYDSLNQAELAATATALERGDKAPLVRLGGESLRPYEPDPPEEFSDGANVAAFCNDQDFVWNRADPVSVRKAKYDRALAALGPRAFAPLSHQTWTARFLSAYCTYWPAPDRFTPAVAKDARVRGVPTVIMSGDFDTGVPTATTRELLRIFPKATFMQIAGAAHPAAAWSDCARLGQQEFQATLNPAAVTRCDVPEGFMEATSRFPKTAAEAAPAAARAGDASTLTDRKVATVAVQTVRDVWLRSFRVPGDLGSVTGLRGGTSDFDWTAFPYTTNDLHGTRFATDVSVSGFAGLDFEVNRSTFQVSVDGPGQADGSLTAEGGFGGGRYSDFVVTGTLGGRTIAVSVPAN